MSADTSNIVSFLKAQFGYLEKTVDPDKPALQKLADLDLHCFQAVNAKLHDLERGTCLHRDENSQTFSIQKTCMLDPDWSQTDF